MARNKRRVTKQAQPMPPQIMAALSQAYAQDLWKPGDTAKISFDVVRWPTGAPEGQIRRVEVMLSQPALSGGHATLEQILASRDEQIAEWNKELLTPPSPPAPPDTPQENNSEPSEVPTEQSDPAPS